MSVFKIHKISNYTSISNKMLRDKDLSHKARGLLSMILSLPPDWKYSIAGLASISKEGEESITNTLKELTENNYLKITKRNNKITGRMEYEYNFYEEKQQNTTYGTPGVGNPVLDRAVLLNKEEQNKERNINNNTISKSNTEDSSGTLNFSMSPFGDSAADNCPYQEIVNLYHKLLPTNPRVRELTKSRKTKIRTLWKEKLKKLENWERYFDFIADSDFLTGRSKSCNNVKIFNLEWFTTPSHFADIIEQKYHGGKK